MESEEEAEATQEEDEAAQVEDEAAQMQPVPSRSMTHPVVVILVVLASLMFGALVTYLGFLHGTALIADPPRLSSSDLSVPHDNKEYMPATGSPTLDPTSSPSFSPSYSPSYQPSFSPTTAAPTTGTPTTSAPTTPAPTTPAPTTPAPTTR